MLLRIENDVNLIRLLVKKFTEKKGECLVWTNWKSTSTKGVPFIQVNGAYLAVIKVTCHEKWGYKPVWEHMKQICGTLNCLNPDHYTDATPEDEKSDVLVRKPTQQKIFSLEEAGELWDRYHIFGELIKTIAKTEGVHKRTAGRAIKRYGQYLKTIENKDSSPE